MIDFINNEHIINEDNQDTEETKKYEKYSIEYDPYSESIYGSEENIYSDLSEEIEYSDESDYYR